MTQKRKREKVVAEITAAHLMQLMQEQGRFLDQQQAVNFLNEEGRAYIMWKQMMYAGENYIKSVLAQDHQPRGGCTSILPVRSRSERQLAVLSCPERYLAQRRLVGAEVAGRSFRCSSSAQACL